MRVCSMAVLMAMVLGGAWTFAAEPTNLEELKAHFESAAEKADSFTADYKMSMDMTAAGQPAAPGMEIMVMRGKLVVKGENMRMDMAMPMPMGDQSTEMKMQMLMKDGFMHMVMDMGTMIQAMKMDMTVISEMAEALGIPESALNSGNMGMGAMGNPAKMLEEYEKTHTLKFEGKETLNGEEVYVLSATLKAEVLENFKKVPMLQQQAGVLSEETKVYLGANDGIMRKLDNGNFMTMTLENVDLEAEISDADLELAIPDGIQVIDMTEMLKATFANIAATTGADE